MDSKGWDASKWLSCVPPSLKPHNTLPMEPLWVFMFHTEVSLARAEWAPPMQDLGFYVTVG